MMARQNDERDQNARMRGESLKSLRLQARLTGAELARKLGTSRQMVKKHEDGARSISADWLERYARAYGLSLSEFIRKIETIENPGEQLLKTTLTDVPLRGEIGLERVNIDPVGTSKMPVYASVAGEAGQMLFEAIPTAYVVTPKPLEDVVGAYGVYVVGESMVPVYRPGELLLINPTKPCRSGDRVVIVMRSDGGWAEAMIKEYVSGDDRQVRLRQFNPAKEFSVERSAIRSIHLIVGVFVS